MPDMRVHHTSYVYLLTAPSLFSTWNTQSNALQPPPPSPQSESSLLPLEKQQAQQERRRDLLHAARDQTKALDAELAARNAVEAEASAATAADGKQDTRCKN